MNARGGGKASPPPPVLTIDRSRSSPNHGVRAAGVGFPDMILLHYTGMRDGASAIDWLCNAASQVSCHYVVLEDGGVLQLVPDHRRAWHAGRGSWGATTDVNSVSIGVEIVNGGHDFGLPPYPDRQIDSVISLCVDLATRHAIPAHRILGHSDVAPARKRDPGELFPWERLAAAGLGRWVEPAADRPGPALSIGHAGDDVRTLQAMLARYGYGLATTGHFDPETETVVRAFQRHFRPDRVDGVADAGTLDTLRRLLDADV